MVGTSTSGNHNPKRTATLCSAMRTDGRNPCRAPAMANGKCRVHGGASLTGIAHPNWKGGRHWQSLGPKLGPIVAEMMNDPDRHSMAQELALVDARVNQLLSQLENGNSSASWTGLAEAMADFTNAQSKGKAGLPVMHEAVARMQQLIAQGAGETLAWAELLKLIEQRRVLVESDERRAVTSGRAVPADQVLSMISALLRVVVDEVSDPLVRNLIQQRVNALVGRTIPTGSSRVALEARRG